MKRILGYLTVILLLPSVTVAWSKDSCPWDATGPGIEKDCQVTLGYSGDVNWWEHDVQACWTVSPDNVFTRRYHQFGHFFPRCDVDQDGYISIYDALDIYYHIGDCPPNPNELEYLVGYATDDKVQLIFKGQHGVSDGYRIAYKQGSFPLDCSGDDGSTVHVETNAYANGFVIDQPGGDIFARVCSYSDVPCNASAGLTIQPKNLEASPHTQCIADNLETLETKFVALYLAFFAENPILLETTGLCQKSASFQEIFWNSLEQTELSGAPIDQPTPPEYAPFDPDFEYLYWLDFDRDETIMANKQAWAFYMELHQVFNWSLLDYTPEQLDDLLNRVDLWGTVIDFSIADTFNIAAAQLTGGILFDGTAREAVVKIVDLSRQLLHGSGTSPLFGTPVTIEDMLSESTPAEWWDVSYYKSRAGCGNTSSFLRILTASINIPSKNKRGYYLGHTGWIAPTVDAALAHGDDVYNRRLTNVPSDTLLDSYERLEAVVAIHGDSSDATYWHAKSHHAKIEAMYPGELLVDNFCGGPGAGGLCGSALGWNGIREYQIGFYLDPTITQKTCHHKPEPHYPDSCEHTWQPKLLEQLFEELCTLAPECHAECAI